MKNRHKENGKWVYDDDDGRTVADMSGVCRRNLIFPGRIGDFEPPEEEDEKEENAQPYYHTDLTPDRGETAAHIFGTLAAGLLVLLVFLIVAAAVIGLILLIGK